MRVLEPSAGDGALVEYSIDLGRTERLRSGCSVFDFICFEIDPDRSRHLTYLGFCVADEPDFLKARHYDRPRGEFIPFDRVIMNPPFSRGQDVTHVTEALKYLAPDGLLVAIMSAGVTFRMNQKTVDFRLMVAERGGTITPNPEGSFKPSGTNVNTVTVVIPGDDFR